jgi:hypothetical protein
MNREDRRDREDVIAGYSFFVVFVVHFSLSRIFAEPMPPSLRVETYSPFEE